MSSSCLVSGQLLRGATLCGLVEFSRFGMLTVSDMAQQCRLRYSAQDPMCSTLLGAKKPITFLIA
jgi:hypothetical protein